MSPTTANMPLKLPRTCATSISMSKVARREQRKNRGGCLSEALVKYLSSP
jgi:hypothetical protein